MASYRVEITNVTFEKNGLSSNAPEGKPYLIQTGKLIRDCVESPWGFESKHIEINFAASTDERG